MMKIFGTLVCVALTVQAHDEYRGKCPTFRPMQGFDWNRVRVIFSVCVLFIVSMREKRLTKYT